MKENVLPNPNRITPADYEDYLLNLGKGWVHDDGDIIKGFAIVSLQDHNVWALFVDPDAERCGIGRQLHDTMVHWYFSKSSEPLWLTTSPCTRAERFYQAAGWQQEGTKGGELYFVKYK